jgi:G:T/U-mismatch repair DNA glycosylase
MTARPTRSDLQAAYGTLVPDLVGPGMRVLLCGINPSLWSGAVGLHFATPGNRLWPVLHGSGWTPRRLHPSETEAVLAAGLGITNLVGRATARADELTDEEVRAGLPAVADLARTWQPAWVAFLGLTAYRTATGRRTAVVALILAIAAYTPVVPFVGAVVALFLAGSARRDILASGGRQTGLGLCTAATVLSIVHLVLIGLLVVLVIGALALPFSFS